MDIPNEKAFAEWRELASQNFAQSIYERLVSMGDAERDDVLLSALLEAHGPRDKEMWGAVRKTTVFKWLDNKTTYRSVVTKVSEARRKIYPAEHQQSLEEWAHSKAEQLRGSYPGAGFFKHLFDVSPANSYTGGFINALDRYLHEDAQAITRAASEFEESIRRLIEDAAKVEQLSGLLGEFIRPVTGVRSLHRLNDRIEEWRLFSEHVSLKRRDPRRPEQLFVYRMEKLNLRHTGKPKTDLIADLMGLGCFRYVYDERSIQRLCADAKKARSEARRRSLEQREQRLAAARSTGL